MQEILHKNYPKHVYFLPQIRGTQRISEDLNEYILVSSMTVDHPQSLTDGNFTDLLTRETQSTSLEKYKTL